MCVTGDGCLPMRDLRRGNLACLIVEKEKERVHIETREIEIASK